MLNMCSFPAQLFKNNPRERICSVTATYGNMCFTNADRGSNASLLSADARHVYICLRGSTAAPKHSCSCILMRIKAKTGLDQCPWIFCLFPSFAPLKQERSWATVLLAKWSRRQSTASARAAVWTLWRSRCWKVRSAVKLAILPYICASEHIRDYCTTSLFQ